MSKLHKCFGCEVIVSVILSSSGILFFTCNCTSGNLHISCHIQHANIH
uniref:Predicted protein n=1 Tax=Hordeum vulgare subsp. vulgare TaxID=112509 RepID=F2D228_HORVV|nr:predicted protein [Hordeum vulgare subsp. vulgare]